MPVFAFGIRDSFGATRGPETINALRS